MIFVAYELNLPLTWKSPIIAHNALVNAWFGLMTVARYIALSLISRYHCLDPTNRDISGLHCILNSIILIFLTLVSFLWKFMGNTFTWSWSDYLVSVDMWLLRFHSYWLVLEIFQISIECVVDYLHRWPHPLKTHTQKYWILWPSTAALDCIN